MLDTQGESDHKFMRSRELVLQLGLGIILLASAGCSSGTELNSVQVNTPQMATTWPTEQSPNSGLSAELNILSNISITIPPGRYGDYQGYHPIGWSPDGRTLAYSWRDSIWLLETASLVSRRLATVDNAQLGEVYYSPDGNQIAFYGNQAVDGQTSPQNFIWSSRIDGAELKNLTASMKLGLRLMYVNQWLDSQTVTFYVWRGNEVQTLNTVNVVTDEIKTLIGVQENVPSPQAIGGNYYFSPNHQVIAIQTGFGGQIAIVAREQPDSRKWITDAPFPLRQSFQAWMPDNNRFLYTEWENGDPDLGLLSSDVTLRLWDIDTNTFTKLLDGVAAAALSFDGTQIAFLQQKDSPWVYAKVNGLNVNQSAGVTSLELGVLDLATNKITMLGPAGYKQEENPDKTLRYWQLGRPAWSPDGSLVAYWGDDGNTYLISPDGRWRQQLTNGLDIVQFLWSPDGSKLALRTMDQAWIIENPKK
jgi:Tol biopolymer transport system component